MPKRIMRTNADLSKLRMDIKSGKAKPNHVVYAYKASACDGRSPQYPNIKPILRCKAGQWLRVPKADCNDSVSCAAGVNVATLKWVKIHHGGKGINRCYKLWLMKFTVADIATIPYYWGHSKRVHGKFRLYKGLIVQQVTHPNFLTPKRKVAK